MVRWRQMPGLIKREQSQRVNERVVYTSCTPAGRHRIRHRVGPSVLRRLLVVVDADDSERVSAAMPTVQRLGYALGAAWVGIVANAVGLEGGDFEAAARRVFTASLALAMLKLLAAFVSPLTITE